jgi:uncharacterized OsmC-like protein
VEPKTINAVPRQPNPDTVDDGVTYVGGQQMGAAAEVIINKSDWGDDLRGKTRTQSAHVVCLEGQQKVARFRHFEIMSDEPHYLGGQDEYPQPLTYMVAGLAFCLLTQLKKYAVMTKTEVTRAECFADFDFNVNGSVLKDTIQASVESFRVRMIIDSPEPDEKVHRIIRLAKHGCFAEALVSTAVQIENTFEINGKEAAVNLNY